MKFLTKLFLLSLFTLATLSVNAQLSIGILAGANFATISYSADVDISFDPTSITGLIIAVPLDISISEKFSVQPEIVFIQKGFKEETTEVYLGVTQHLIIVQIINYIEVPILAKYLFLNSESVSIYGALGPVFGYALSGKIKAELNGEKETRDIDWNDYDRYQRFEVSVSLGAGAGFSVGPGQIIVDLRYVLGLTNLSDGSFENEKINNRGFGATVGYMFPISD